MPDFSNARVGDRVYDIRFGEGKITSVNKSGRNFTITCSFPATASFPAIDEYYDRNGKWDYRHIGPVLFHAKPEISDPPPPKRKVKRQAWLNIYPANNRLSAFSGSTEGSKLSAGEILYRIYYYETKEKADEAANNKRIACISIEWEEE